MTQLAVCLVECVTEGWLKCGFCDVRSIDGTVWRCLWPLIHESKWFSPGQGDILQKHSGHVWVFFKQNWIKIGWCKPKSFYNIPSYLRLRAFTQSQTACGQKRSLCMFKMACGRNSVHVRRHTILNSMSGCDRTQLTQRQDRLTYDCHRNASLLFVVLLLTRTFFANAIQRKATPTMYHYTRWRNVH